MRAMKFALSVMCLSLLLGISGPAQAQSDTFTLRVCNSYNKPILLALVHRVAPNDQRFVVKGWFEVPVGCAEDDLPRGNIGTFAFAIGNNRIEKMWRGDIPVCVVDGRAFERILTDNYRCRRENQEVLVPFQGWRVTDQPELEIEFK